MWAKRVERWRESGLTAKEYAAEVGLNANTLAHWGWRLRGEEQAKPRRKPAKAGRGQRGWLEVVAPGGDSTVATIEMDADGGAGGRLGSSMTGWFELVMGSGRVIRVPAEFDGQALSRLLAVLEAR